MKSNSWFPILGMSMGMLMFIFFTPVSYGQLFGAREKGKKYGYINDRGDYVIAPTFDGAGFFSKGAAVVQLGKKFGIINEQGQFTVEPIYDGANYYAPEGKFTVKKGTQWGVVNASGEVIIPFEYQFLSVFKNGYVVAGTFIPGKQYKGRVCPTVLNEKNEVIYSTGQNDPEGHDCSQLFLPGFVNESGNYSMGWPMVREGMLVVLESWEGGPKYYQYRILNVKTGSGPVLPYEIVIADDYLGLREGLLAMDRAEFDEDSDSENQPYGRVNIITSTTKRKGVFMDTTQIKSESFDPMYDENYLFKDITFQRAHPYFNGVAPVEIDNKWAFVDREGWIINETKLSTSDYRATPPMYFNGLIGFFKNGKAGYVDITGKEVIPFTLDEYHPFEFSVTPVKMNGLYGLMRKDGTWAVSPRFVDLFVSPCPCYQ